MGIYYHSEVLHGDKQGRKISFPTINLNTKIWPKNKQAGVYSCTVTINDSIYDGALYFGPRTINNEEKNVLEIFLLNFSHEIYGTEVFFQLHTFIRPVLHLSSLQELKSQIEKDVVAVKKSLLIEI